MKKLLGLFAAVLVSVGLTGGIVAANSGMLGTTGPDSDNSIWFGNESDVDVENDTSVDVDMDVDQDADSGDARVKYNTTGGDAESGDATNEHSLEGEISIDNSGSSSKALGCGCANGDDDASIENTGPNSRNKVVFKNNSRVDVNNDTDVDLNVDVNQNARSGDASVYYNTTGGNATSGNASNSSSSSFSISVTN